MVPAAQQEQVQDLVVTEGRRQPLPQLVAYVGGVVECVHGFDEEPIAGVLPAGIGRGLRDLGRAGLVVKDEADAYTLTDLGSSLGRALRPLESWANRWAAAVPVDAPEGR